MAVKPLILMLACGAGLTASGCASTPKTQGELLAARDERRAVARETLEMLDALQPGAKRAVESAYAYAVFSNFGMKILVAGGGTGRGVAVRNAPFEETFMRMASISAGLGMGVKKLRLVWVFTAEPSYRQFVDHGWELGGHADAQAMLADQGAGFAGAVVVSPGVYLYQIMDDGLALELTVTGTKYFKDGALN